MTKSFQIPLKRFTSWRLTGFTQDFSKSRLLRSRDRLLPQLKLNVETVPNPRTSFLLTGESTSDLAVASPPDGDTAPHTRSSRRLSFYNRLPEKIKRRYLTQEELSFLLGTARSSSKAATAIDEEFQDFNMNTRPLTGPAFSGRSNVGASQEHHVDDYHATLREQLFDGRK